MSFFGGEEVQRIRVSAEDPESLDRIQRSIIMIVHAAVGRLEALGYERGTRSGRGIEIATDSDGLPIFIKLDGEVVFTVRERVEPRGGLTISGEWQRDVYRKKPGFWARLFRRK